jgi:hypothetical protein
MASGALLLAARAAIRRIDGLVESPSVFGEGDASWMDGTQVVNWLDDGLEVRLTLPVIRAERQRLKADARVELKSPSSPWVIVRPRSRADVPFVVEMVEMAAAAHRPARGVPLKPPPQGADLARRRRFH